MRDTGVTVRENRTVEINSSGMDPKNGAEGILSFSKPYIVNVMIEWVSDIIFHRWDSEGET